MESHFLDEYVTGNQSFNDAPWYNQDGDCLVCQIADEAVVAKRIDDVLTIYHSANDDRPIGFQIKGVQALMHAFGLDGLSCCAHRTDTELMSISLSAILLAAYERGPQTMGRRIGYATALEHRPTQPSISADQLVLG